jgi:ribosomal protein L44E
MNNYKPNWNKRNGQRATVKRPGTKEYRADFRNKGDQFYKNGTRAACTKCNSVDVYAVGGNGRLIIYCAHCGTQLKVINTKPTKVGNWSEQKKFYWRAGLCLSCGNGRYTGKMHLSSDMKRYDLQLKCSRCGARIDWHNL